ncbi:hypothetical protein ABB37_05584 [Leptomonas pyrrhocoris]|uniref:Uncharacterized protein n=1 Tax=Leptomonas pyrrhocoris TaxID=157538 RepID=A0A0N0VEW0_LEPPY|nr:hypothetical protein ABB37_05584 [Leptomonas pyrrhocoris]KPA79051.1 hypothetical protein ABB37_05584 [Leptomonas pyrrhocoris]|eukprot:XP_015657490.1 hypothetical protein ABB37_05584 [Leptomonas pyrrhocoris]
MKLHHTTASCRAWVFLFSSVSSILFFSLFFFVRACARKKSPGDESKASCCTTIPFSPLQSTSLQERLFSFFPTVPPLFQPHEVEMQTI